MTGFKNPALKQLTDQQVRFAPAPRRLEQRARAERLLAEVEPSRRYPYQFICWRITDYRPDSYPDQLMLRCILSPNDSCATPICSERNRESPPTLPAITWSIEGPLGPRPVNRVPVISPLMELVCPLPCPPAAALSRPLIT